ncbi:MAG TPA: sugar MFS transporter [Candidatus Polarisedimenticolia bacterium]|jgi:FHS family L-fucose permease-like MFS transporter|nr:sugar MFS transporter [Candidatus Polarisedimenticolia bacterium]
MSIATPSRSAEISPDSSSSYRGPLAVVTTLFFMWGFLTCLNDILVPHLKSIFDLNYRQVMLVQFAFFGAYFLFSIPSAKIIDWIGYQRSMVMGLLAMGVGAFLFVPAASVPSYPLFLAALVVLAAGITCLQVAANPYVTVLGKPETASSRLNLTQAFNSLGTFLAPFFGGLLILSAAPKAMEEIRAMAPDALQAYRLHEAATVKTPYVGLGIALVVLAAAIGSFKLPKIPQAQHKVGEKVNDSIWKHPNLIFGAIGIFVYVGAEVAIGSFLVNYFSQPEIGGLTEKVAASFVAFYWGGAMVGRFIGSALLGGAKATYMGLVSAVAAILVVISYPIGGHLAAGSQTGFEAFLWNVVWVLVTARPLFALVAVVALIATIAAVLRGGQVTLKTGRLLGAFAVSTSVLVATSMLSSGHFAMWSIILVGFFNSIMFPSIFTLGVAELGPLTGDGSGIMIMAIVGGAIIPLAQGAIADRVGIHHAFFLPVVCYLYIVFFALSGSKPNSERHARS